MIETTAEMPKEELVKLAEGLNKFYYMYNLTRKERFAIIDAMMSVDRKVEK